MATITLTTKAGEKYVLTFTRREITQMADSGFDIKKLDTNPLEVITLFAGAFLHNHRGTPRATIEALWKGIEDKAAFAERLGALYGDPIADIFEEPEDESKKVEWEETK